MGRPERRDVHGKLNSEERPRCTCRPRPRTSEPDRNVLRQPKCAAWTANGALLQNCNLNASRIDRACHQLDKERPSAAEDQTPGEARLLFR